MYSSVKLIDLTSGSTGKYILKLIEMQSQKFCLAFSPSSGTKEARRNGSLLLCGVELGGAGCEWRGLEGIESCVVTSTGVGAEFGVRSNDHFSLNSFLDVDSTHQLD